MENTEDVVVDLSLRIFEDFSLRTYNIMKKFEMLSLEKLQELAPSDWQQSEFGLALGRDGRIELFRLLDKHHE